MRYLIALSFVIIGTVVGSLSYGVWTSGPPVVLASPAKLALTEAGNTPLLPGGWTNSSMLNLRLVERAPAGADVELRPWNEAFTNTPTQSVSAAGGTGCQTGPCASLQVHVADGVYHMQTRLHGASGVSTWVPYKGDIKVDLTPPVAPQISSSTDPVPTKVYHTGTMQFSWHTSDSGSGIAGYSYRLDKAANGVPRTELRIGTPTVSLKGLDSGKYYFHVRAKDNAGNWGPTSTFPVRIDVTPPGLTHVRFSVFQFDPQFNSLRVSFGVTKGAREVHVGIYRQSDNYLTRLYKLSDLKAGQAASVSWDGKGAQGHFVTPGLYSIFIRATDAYGHSTVSGWRDFSLDYRHIYISLSQERLWAYDGNAVVLTSLVTTGNPALPTPRGTFAIVGKFHPFTFRSPWPKSSPYYYPPSPTQYAMLFREGGYFIHDAPWRSNFGPGSNTQLGKPGDNYTGTHGCVNVPPDVAYKLFQWASLGTVVQVGK